jgi:hypothetical protein
MAPATRSAPEPARKVRPATVHLRPTGKSLRANCAEFAVSSDEGFRYGTAQSARCMMSTNTHPVSTNTPPAPARSTAASEVIIFGHSWLFYWWPVWVIGYVMALLSWLHPVAVQVGGANVVFSSHRDLGVVYALILLLMILLTTTSMRGLVSSVVVLCVAFLVLLFAYLNWWTEILSWFGQQPVYMNLGFYLFVSTGLLLIWLLVVGVFDHLSFWRIRAGQVTHEYVWGAVESSYDTDNMVFTKQQADLFRNWILGFGSGDLQMQTMGGRGVVAKVSNVLFLNARMTRIQRLIATKPEVPEQV